jgi:hypothetical protein
MSLIRALRSELMIPSFKEQGHNPRYKMRSILKRATKQNAEIQEMKDSNSLVYNALPGPLKGGVWS